MLWIYAESEAAGAASVSPHSEQYYSEVDETRTAENYQEGGTTVAQKTVPMPFIMFGL